MTIAFRAAKVDPANRLLWKYPLRRLDAEAIRDGMLAVSGELDRRMYGPYTPTQRTATGNVIVARDPAETHRRSIYLQQRRTQVNTFLELFKGGSLIGIFPQFALLFIRKPCYFNTFRGAAPLIFFGTFFTLNE